MPDNIATTQWSQVLAARDGSESEARRALESLCQTYWQPLYAYVRHRGSDPEEARDLTQAFLAVLLEKDFLADIDPSKGRFRSFLLASLRHFLLNEADRNRTLKRGGGIRALSLDVDTGEASYTSEPVEAMTPEDVFERRWAMAILDRALSRLQQEAHESGDTVKFDQLKSYLTSTDAQVPYSSAAETLGMSEGAVATAVHRLRQRYGQFLRAEILQIVADPAQVDDELRHMLRAVSA